MAAPSKTREQLIDEAARIRSNIDDIFADAEHWNRLHPDEPAIDPDPDGQLHRARAGLDRLLTREGR